MFSKGENGEIVLIKDPGSQVQEGDENEVNQDNMMVPINPRQESNKELDIFNNFLGQFCNKEAKQLVRSSNDPDLV